MKKLNKENNIKINKKENAIVSTDVHMTLDLNNPSLLTPAQKGELDALSDLPDNAVRKEAEADPDCEPLE